MVARMVNPGSAPLVTGSASGIGLATIARAGIIGLVKALTPDVPSVRFSVVAQAWPLPEEPWLGADVDWETSSPPRDGLSIGRAIASAVLFLANDKEGHPRGQVIRIPSGVTT